MRKLAVRILVTVSIFTSLFAMSGFTGAPSVPVKASAGVRIPPGTVIHDASCEQRPPQFIKDRASYTPAEQARYGLPPRSPGEPFDHWAQIVRSLGKRICDRTVTNITSSVPTNIMGTSDQGFNIWAGNIADVPFLGVDSYTEADLNFTVPCIGATSGNYDSYAFFWEGIGGWGNNNLVQVGVVAHHLFVANNGWYTTYTAGIENFGDTSNPGFNEYMPVNCGDFMWVKVYNGNCMFVNDVTKVVDNGGTCYGPAANTSSAEGIAERPSIDGVTQLLPNFGSVHFEGIGVTDNGAYYAIENVNHDYSNMWSFDGSHTLVTVGPITYDPNDYPNDQYTMSWHANS